MRAGRLRQRRAAQQAAEADGSDDEEDDEVHRGGGPKEGGSLLCHTRPSCTGAGPARCPASRTAATSAAAPCNGSAARTSRPTFRRAPRPPNPNPAGRRRRAGGAP
jgi:hypothetical protein